MKKLILIISAITFTIGLQAQVNFQNNTVTGTNASSLGENNESSGYQSFSSGKSCISSGNQSVAMGFNSEANNFTATSIGAYNNASGAMSTALGSRCNTQATGTVAIGNRLSANATYSFVIGNGITDYNLENNINHSLMIGFDSNIPTFFVGPGNGNYNSLGRIGIGTTSPSKLLDVAGTMNVDNDVTFGSDLDISGGLNVNNAAAFGNNLDVAGEIATSQLQVTQGAANGKILQSDADGNASWVDPMSIGVDDGDWEINGNNVYRLNGNVGIGTSTPGYRLHITDDAGDYDYSFFKISNENSTAGGTIALGKLEGNGPAIIQQSGNVAFVDSLGNITSYPRVSLMQKSKNGETGLLLSTYTDETGAVNYVDMQAPESDMYFRSLNNLVFRTGETKDERMRITAQGNVGIGKIPS